MSVNMNSLNPLDPGSTSSDFASTSSSSVSTNSAVVDSLTSSTSTANVVDFGKIVLPTPSMSISDFYNAVATVMREFKQQLGSSTVLDQEMSKFLSYANASSTANIAELAILIAQEQQQVVAKAAAAVVQLQALLDNAKQLATNMTNATNTFNNSNNDINQLNGIINSYINVEGSANAGSNGTYSTDADFKHWNGKVYGDTSTPQSLVNAVNGFNGNVTSFNTYVTTRNNQVAAYNQARATYIQGATDSNQAIANFLATYNLTSYVNANNYNVNLPTNINTASSLDYANYAYTNGIVTLPGNGKDIPNRYYADINTPIGLASWSNQSAYVPLGNNNKPTFPTNYNADTFKKMINDGIYAVFVTPLQNALAVYMGIWSYNNALITNNPLDRSLTDPISKFEKPVALRLLPDSVSNQQDVTASGQSQGGQALTSLAAGLGSPDLGKVLNKAFFAQFVQQSLLGDLKPQAQDQLVDKLQILTASLIKSNVLPSLMPGISAVADNLHGLTPDSPVFGIAVSASFANRANEQIANGNIESTISQFIDGSPELANLTPEQKADLIQQLTPVIGLSLSIVSTLLIAKSLGLNNLLPQILNQLPLSPEEVSSILTQAATEQNQDLTALQSQIFAKLTGEGMDPKAAQFLSQFGAELAGIGLLTPTATSVSPTTVRSDVLVNSLQASLMLEGKGLAQAQNLSNKAINRTMAEGPFPTTAQFMSALQETLLDLGLGKMAAPVAAGVLVLPGAENPLHTATPTLSGSKVPISIGLPATVSVLMDQLNAVPPNLARTINGELKLQDGETLQKVTQDTSQAFVDQGYSQSTADFVASTITSQIQQDQIQQGIITADAARTANLQALALNANSSVDNSPPPPVDTSSVDTSSVSTSAPTQPAPVDTSSASDEIALSDQDLSVSNPDTSYLASAQTSQDVQTSAIRNSIISALLLNDIKLKDAVSDTDTLMRLLDGTAAGDAQFKAQLANLLLILGFKDLLIQKILTGVNNAIDNLNAPKPDVTPPEIQSDIIKEDVLRRSVLKRAVEILQPQLGAKLANSIAEDVAAALFGTPNPDTADKANVKKSNSIVNSLKAEVHTIIANRTEDYAKDLHETFATSIKSSVQLDKFLEKVMDLSNLFLYGMASAGIMYGGHEPSNFEKGVSIKL